MTDLAWVFVAGGALELAGLGCIAWDVLDVHRKRDTITADALRNQPFNKYTVAEATYRLIAGNLRLRALGVVLFVIGVVVQTFANICAL